MFHALLFALVALVQQVQAPPASTMTSTFAGVVLQRTAVDADGAVLTIESADVTFASVEAMQDPGTAARIGGAVTQDDTQLPIGPDPVLTTTWTDAAGVTHTVETPIPSTTPAGLARAVSLHNELVKLLQAAHPPRPITPP